MPAPSPCFFWTAASAAARHAASPMNSCEYDTRPFMLSRSSRWAYAVYQAGVL